MVKVNQESYALIFKELLEGEMSAHDAVEITGLHLVTAQSLFRSLKKHKVVHIAAWDTDRMGRDVTPIYALGAKRDKPRRRMSGAERQRLSRARRGAIAIINGVVA